LAEREIDTQKILAEVDQELANFNAGLKTLEQKRSDILVGLRKELAAAALEKARKALG